MAQTITITARTLSVLLENAVLDNEHTTDLYNELHYIFHNYNRIDHPSIVEG